MLRDEGFELAGISAAAELSAPRKRAFEALAAGELADMAWMDAEWLERATSIQRFLPGAASVIVVALPNHAPNPELVPDGPARGRVARYAWGRDYHRVFERKLRRAAKQLGEEFGAEARATVDYGPLLERPHAALAGLAWLGKSTMALVPGSGPWVMLGVIATTLELEPNVPLKKTCGSCTRCIVACPTEAIAPDGHVLDSRRCISYQTIENRGPIPRDLRASFGDWVFGCDACLDACPVGATRFDAHPDFLARDADAAFPPLAELLALDDDAFAERFRGRAVMRARRDGLARNAAVALGNVGGVEDLGVLVSALSDSSPLVRGHAAWAIGRLAMRHGIVAEAVRALENALAIEQDGSVREEIACALEALAAGGSDGRPVPA